MQSASIPGMWHIGVISEVAKENKWLFSVEYDSGIAIITENGVPPIYVKILDVIDYMGNNINMEVLMATLEDAYYRDLGK